MLDTVKKLAVNMLTGASVVTSLFLIGVGYCDFINPIDSPSLACLGLLFPFFIAANLLMLIVMLIFKWKRALIPVIGFALAYGPIRTYFPIHLKKDVPEDCVKVLSYNVCGYGGNYRYEKALDTIIAYVQHIDPDIVCLQEDHRAKGGNPVEAWKNVYPYNDTTIVSSASAAAINVIGVHTRFPIIRKERIQYESTSNGSVAYYLKAGQDTIIVINNHLEHTHLTSADRDNYKKVIRGGMEREDAEEEALHIIDQLGIGMSRR